jgi:hypothetical protein
MKNFLKRSIIKFKDENMFILINPSHEEITAAMEMAKLKVSLYTHNGRALPWNPVNVFCYYSGHGSSISGKLHISAPTVLTQDEYVSQKDNLPEIRPIS